MRLLTAIAATCFLLSSSAALSESAPIDYLHLNWMDKKGDPSKDFYEYANGRWQKEHPIPAAYSSWNIFLDLHERNQDIIKHIIQAAVDKPHPSDIEQKVGDFYYSGMDLASIEKLGAKPLQPELERIARISNLKELERQIAHLQMIGVDVPFGFGQMQDFKNSSQVIGVATQSGLGLPDRDYYLKTDKHFVTIRQAYMRHVAKIFSLLGDDAKHSQQEAQTVMKIETALAKASLSREAQRDPQAVYHIKTLQELNAITPEFSWNEYFAELRRPDIKQINLAMPDFFKEMNAQLAHTPLNDWKTYLRWHLVGAYAGALSKPFVDENFKMASIMTGAKQLLPRWKRVVNVENEGLGFAIGEIYVKNYFPPASKDKAEGMILHIRAALREDLEKTTWMSPQTRQAALQKLAKMEDRVGYPNKWWDYSSLQIDRGPYALNLMRVNTFLNQRELDKIGKPVDTEEWDMTPQTVNAYYDPSMNRLNIPAGILQSPFFDPNAPEAVNYGGIGFVIGHEMTHGFDDEGAQFDAQGNLKNWWAPQDLQKFRVTTHNIAKQFSRYVVAGDHVHGKLVTGEATADLGGLELAYHAFHEYEYPRARLVEGYTPDQQFFLSSAHVWATNMRAAEMRRLVVTDPHPPALYRVNGTLANMPEFEKAFHVADHSPMVNPERIALW